MEPSLIFLVLKCKTLNSNTDFFTIWASFNAVSSKIEDEAQHILFIAQQLVGKDADIAGTAQKKLDCGRLAAEKKFD